MSSRMRRHGLVLAALGLLVVAAGAYAGPNNGGTLIVHDTGYWFTLVNNSYPSPPPVDCQSVDNQMPTTVPGGYHGRVWKVYAAFVAGTTPRLKALSLGADFNEDQVVILNAGLPDPAHDFEIPQLGWPVHDGGGVGISFGSVKTDPMNEVYWFGGYSYYAAPCLWSTAPHPVQTSIFVDDAFPPNEDRIAGFSSIGFGLPGNTVCPGGSGACCFTDASCQILTALECAAAGGTFGFGPACEPNPCPRSTGRAASSTGLVSSRPWWSAPARTASGSDLSSTAIRIPARRRCRPKGRTGGRIKLLYH